MRLPIPGVSPHLRPSWGGLSLHSSPPLSLTLIQTFSKSHLRRSADSIPAAAKNYVSVIVHLVQHSLNIAFWQAKFLRHHFSICRWDDLKVAKNDVSHVILKFKPIAIATAYLTSKSRVQAPLESSRTSTPFSMYAKSAVYLILRPVRV